MTAIGRIHSLITQRLSILGPLVLLIMLLIAGAIGKEYIAEAAIILRENIENAGTLGYLIFIVAFIVAALIGVFPLSLLAVLGGMIFGLILGFVLAAIGIMLGAGGAFLVGRYALRSTIEEWLSRRSGLSRFDSEIGAHGWKLVGLLRLSPFAPFSISSYAFSLTKINFSAYMLGTLGVCPPLFAFVYTGSISGVAFNAFLLNETELNQVQLLAIGAGFIATIIVAVLIVRIARRALLNHSGD